jgi:hypothetical protein
MLSRLFIIVLLVVTFSRIEAASLKGVIHADVQTGEAVERVEIAADGANVTASDHWGKFTLVFPRKDAGYSVTISVKKEGYAVVNRESPVLNLPAPTNVDDRVVSNQKLTHVVKDKTFKLNASELLISFVDGSTMKVKIAESNSPPLREGARIRKISEDRAKFVIEWEDDSAIDVTLADPGASVAVRDKTYQVEYLG